MSYKGQNVINVLCSFVTHNPFKYNLLPDTFHQYTLT